MDFAEVDIFHSLEYYFKIYNINIETSDEWYLVGWLVEKENLKNNCLLADATKLSIMDPNMKA